MGRRENCEESVPSGSLDSSGGTTGAADALQKMKEEGTVRCPGVAGEVLSGKAAPELQLEGKGQS